MNAEILVRIQFALGIACHIVFPAITIGLAWLLVYFEVRWRRSGEAHWQALYRLWACVFTISFFFGIVTGILQGVQLGSNFSPFLHATQYILGPLRWAEGWPLLLVQCTAIAVMLFGWRRPGRQAHFIATLLIALLLTNAAFWILAANSWMQTPQGMRLENGQWLPEDWLEIIFSPSLPARLAHMLTAALLSTALVVAGVCGYRWRRQQTASSLHGLRTAVLALAVLAPLQIVTGHYSAEVTSRHQPAKFAAMEGLWQSGEGVPLVLWAMPSAKSESNRYAVEIPHGGSLLLTKTWSGFVRGLDSFEPQDRPPVPIVFYSFRAMVVLGMWFLGLGLFGAWQHIYGRLEHSRRYMRLLAWSSPLGFVATILGWIVTEVGRQPWIVSGLMRTSEGITRAALIENVAGSLQLMIGAYALMFVLYIYLMWWALRTSGTKRMADDWQQSWEREEHAIE
jgi:cytochrome d ubiquinol oxidase subunit I